MLRSLIRAVRRLAKRGRGRLCLLLPFELSPDGAQLARVQVDERGASWLGQMTYSFR